MNSPPVQDESEQQGEQQRLRRQHRLEGAAAALSLAPHPLPALPAALPPQQHQHQQQHQPVAQGAPPPDAAAAPTACCAIATPGGGGGDGGDGGVGGGSGLAHLPDEVTHAVAEAIVGPAGGRPADVVRLALACKPVWRALTGASGLWDELSACLGWQRGADEGSWPAAVVTTTATATTSAGAASAHSGAGSSSGGGGGDGDGGAYARLLSLPGGDGGGGAAAEGTAAFGYYCCRMQVRWRLRRAFRRYCMFLDPPSRQAFMPGADLARLQQAEARLGRALPWELWELLRYRNGQAPGPFCNFLDACRMLTLGEMLTDAHEYVPPPADALGQQDSSFALHHLAGIAGSSSRGSGSSGGTAAAAAAAAGGGGDSASRDPLCGAAGPGARRSTSSGGGVPDVLPLTATRRGSQRFVVDWRGRVHKQAGFSRTLMAGSIEAFLLHLLR